MKGETIMAETQHDADIINADWRKQDELMQEHLEKMGVQVRIAQDTGANLYPTEYTLCYSFVEATGPTLDLALLAFTEKLLKHVSVEKA
jgi:hypothetical protein